MQDLRRRESSTYLAWVSLLEVHFGGSEKLTWQYSRDVQDPYPGQGTSKDASKVWLSDDQRKHLIGFIDLNLPFDEYD